MLWEFVHFMYVTYVDASILGIAMKNHTTINSHQFKFSGCC